MDIPIEETEYFCPSLSNGPSPSQTGHPLTSFTLFPKLIIELRLKIWEFCFTIQEARLVEVRTRPHDCESHKGSCPRFSACRLPTLVHVCSEARMVAREQAARAGYLCFGTSAAPPNVFFNPNIDRLYLPVEKEPWMRDTVEQGARARRRALHLGTYQRHHFHALPNTADYNSAPTAVPTTTLFQFKKFHRPADVRFLVSDLDIRPQFIPQDPVWAVMQDFPKLEELVFVVPEHVFVYEDLIVELGRTAATVGQERERWTNAFRDGVVSWEWPVVKLALRCKGGLKFVELEQRYD